MVAATIVWVLVISFGNQWNGGSVSEAVGALTDCRAQAAFAKGRVGVADAFCIPSNTGPR